MIDIEVLRHDIDRVKRAVRDRGMDLDVDQIAELDSERRKLIQELEELQRKKNQVNDEMSLLIKKKQEIQPNLSQLKAISHKIDQMKPKVEDVDRKFTEFVLLIPNLPSKDTPSGGKEGANRIIHTKMWEMKTSVSNFKSHIDLGNGLGILDLERATKIAGSGFALFTGEGARLERALINFMMDHHATSGKYQEISPPYLVKRNCMEGTGQLPKFEEDMYRLYRNDAERENGLPDHEDLFLVPTAEVPLTNLHREEILDEDRLPLRYVACTPCFRLEAGAYGKDTRGLIRVHQFDKVELVKFSRAEDSEKEHEDLLQDVISVFDKLELPYRVVLLSAPDLGFAASKCYDVEVWAPGTGRWLEASSCSNFTDFQSRRASIKYRDKRDRKTKYVHTLNASGVALARTFIALIENYQQPDGSVLIPEVLRPYLGGQTHIKR